MKGYFKWFKNSAKMKRWMIIILVGILLACYGTSKILVEQELQFFDIAKIIVNLTLESEFYRYTA